jgi:hypothetical protein
MERMIQLGDLVVILDLHHQGLSISAIARRRLIPEPQSSPPREI